MSHGLSNMNRRFSVVTGRGMLSRVAESIYWMSRYIERAENVARFIDVNLKLGLDMPFERDQQWEPLIITTGDEEAFYERHDKATREHVVDFLTFDRSNPNSISSCLTYARENARSIREVIGSEMWEVINRFYLNLKHSTLSAALIDPHDFFNDIRAQGQHFTGVTDATMTHSQGWHFANVGRMLERADKTSRILDVKYYILLPSLNDIGTPFDDIQWIALLRSASAFEMYRQRHGRIAPHSVVDFLVLDDEFPRAVLFCLKRANQSLHAISETPIGSYTNPAEQMLGQVTSELSFATSEQIVERGLHEFVDDLQNRLNQVGEKISDTFFALKSIQATPSMRS